MSSLLVKGGQFGDDHFRCAIGERGFELDPMLDESGPSFLVDFEQQITGGTIGGRSVSFSLVLVLVLVAIGSPIRI